MPKKGDLSGFSAAQLEKALAQARKNEAKKKAKKPVSKATKQGRENLPAKGTLRGQAAKKAAIKKRFARRTMNKKWEIGMLRSKKDNEDWDKINRSARTSFQKKLDANRLKSERSKAGAIRRQ